MSGNDILENHLEAVKENSKTVRNIYLSYLGFATYIWLTAESVTHLQLLIPKEGLSLPIIGVKLGVVGFFWVAPILLFLFHIYFALHVWKLAEHMELLWWKNKSKGKDWQDQIPGSMFVWVFLEQSLKWNFISKIMNAFVFLSFWCVVPIVLLRAQWQFLPYHHSIINFLLQSLITLSILFSFFFVRKINRIKPWNSLFSIVEEWWQRAINWTAIIFTISSAILILLFCWTVLIIPKDAKENDDCFKLYQIAFEKIAIYFKPELDPNKKENSKDEEKNKCLHIKDVVARNLNLREKDLALKPGETLIAAYKGENDESKELLKHYGSLSLRRRHLEFADFYKSDLRKSDLRNSYLTGTNFTKAKLRKADFFKANLKEATFQDSNLKEANFRSAILKGSYLERADLKMANLRSAQLQGASLEEANLQGADLSDAYLNGVNLQGAKLQGANLKNAWLIGIDTNDTMFQGASLFRTKLQGANFFPANFQGADLQESKLQGATFEGHDLKGANFYGADLGRLLLNEEWFKDVPIKRNARNNMKEKLLNGKGKLTKLKVEKNLKFRHSFNANSKKQIQFKDVPKQTEDENFTMRKDIYRDLLCEYPVLIKRNLDNIDKKEFDKFPSPLSFDEANDYTFENCPEFLPGKYKNQVLQLRKKTAIIRSILLILSKKY